MTLKFANSNTEWAGEAIDGFKYPATIEERWTDDQLAAIGLVRALPGLPTLSLIKAECERRILLVASRNTQSNLNAYINKVNSNALAKGSLSNDQRVDIEMFNRCCDWIDSMRAAVLTNVDNPAYNEDASWPALPSAELLAFAARF